MASHEQLHSLETETDSRRFIDVHESALQTNQEIKIKRLRCGLFAVSVLLVSLTIFIIVYCVLTEHDSTSPISPSPADVCTTASCIAVSNELLSFMNLSADPCEDFFYFSCGEWQRGNAVHLVDHDRYTPRNQIYDRERDAFLKELLFC